MRSADRVAAVSLIVFAAWFVAIGRRFPYWNPSTGPGSGFLPVWLGVALTVLAILLFLNAGGASAGGGRWLPDPAALRKLVKERDPLEEDIGLYDRGRLVAVVVRPRFHRFALEMAEKRENEIDLDRVRKEIRRKKKTFEVWDSRTRQLRKKNN